MMEKTLKWIHKHHDQPRTNLVLKLALCATRRLTLPELAEGVAVDEMVGIWEQSSVAANPVLLIDDCANLLACVPHPDQDLLQIVVPFHKLVERFLLTDSTKPTRSKIFHRPSVHVELARLCLKYLRLRALRHVRYVLSNIHQYPFAAYAVAGWLEHIRASGTCELVKEFQEFLAPESPTFDNWRCLFSEWSGPFRSLKVLDHLERQVQPAHLAVWFDLPMLIPGFSRDELCAEDYRGLSALHIAMEIPNPISVIKPLLEVVDVNQLSRGGKTALHIAVSQFGGNERAIKAIIQRFREEGAVLDSQDCEGRTALHLAMLDPRAAGPWIFPLLENRASPHARDSSRQTPLHIAAAAPRYRISRASENPECQKKTADAYRDAMNALLIYQSDTRSTDQKGNTPLHLAAYCVNQFAVEPLIKRKALVNVVNDEGYRPLHLAITCNLPGCQRGASTSPEQTEQQFHVIPRRPRNIFATAEQRDQYFTVKYLIRHRASVNRPVDDQLKRSPLHLAAMSCCNVAIFDLLVENGAAVNPVDEEGNTPLHLAARMAPITNPGDPTDQWRVSWTSVRQIISKLITHQSNLYKLHQTAHKILRLISANHPDAISAPSLQDIVDDADHPFTKWFENVKGLLCSRGASINQTNGESQDILTYTISFWSSWININHQAIAARGKTLDDLYTEWTRISRL